MKETSVSILGTVSFLIAVAAFFAAFFIFSTGVEASAFPGANGKIFFASERDGHGEIYSMNADGTGQFRLTNSPDAKYRPAVSPDGSKVLFTHFTGGQTVIAVMNTDGSGQTDISNGFDDEASWSPDGAKILFMRTTTSPTTAFNIWVMNADGSNPTQLTNSGKDLRASWSPDGSTIVFHSDRNGTGRIFVMNPDGSGSAILQNAGAAAYDDYPSWSPDGTKIIFARQLTGQPIHLHAIDWPAGTIQQLTIDTNSDIYPAWSPDGAKISFTRLVGGSNFEIFTMNANGSGQTSISNNAATDIGSNWQPIPPPPPETQAYYRFETGPNGTSLQNPVLDSSDNHLNGSVLFPGTGYSDDIPTSVIPKTDAANAFAALHGTGGSETFPYRLPFQNRADATLEFWVNPGSVSEGDLIWGSTSPNDTNRYQVYTVDNRIALNYRDPNGGLHLNLVSSINSVPIGRWTHVAFVKHDDLYSIYINGVLQLSVTDVSPNRPTATGWTLNGRANVEGNPCCQFQGSVDEIRLSNRALTPEELLNNQPPQPDLVVSKVNNLGGGNAIVGHEFNWLINIVNNGDADVVFQSGQMVLIDSLPFAPTYGSISVSLGAGITGTLDCTIQPGTVLICNAGGTLVIPAHSNINVVTIPTTPTTQGSETNPRQGETCMVDPDNHIAESDENSTSNICSNTVTVNQSPTTAHITLLKEVINDDGGTAVPTDFVLRFVRRLTPVITEGIMGSPEVTNFEFVPESGRSYLIGESSPPGYSRTSVRCSFNGGPEVEGNQITPVPGDVIVCTQTNNDVHSSLNLRKQVINNSGGTSHVSDWTLIADGPTPFSGTSSGPAGVGQQVEPGEYTISESGPAGYTLTGISCSSPFGGVPVVDNKIMVEANRQVSCTFLNDDVSHVDLIATLSNTLGGHDAVAGQTFEWHVAVTNSGSAPAQIPINTDIIHDDMPGGPTYGEATIQMDPGVTGTASCDLSSFSSSVFCTTTSAMTIPPGQSVTLVVPVTPTPNNTLTNPRPPTGICLVDFEGKIEESNESNNDCNTDTIALVNQTFSDLVVTKTNDLSGAHARVGFAFNWILTFSNNGDSPADFAEGDRVLLDVMPFDALYGDVTLSLDTGMTGSLTCGPTENLNRVYACVAGVGGFHIAAHSGNSTLTIPTTPTAAVSLINPREAGGCIIDPEDHVAESNEAELNTCTDTVAVDPSPDLVISKSNSVAPGNAIVGHEFNWILTFSNIGGADADFTPGQRVVLDAVPLDATYGVISVSLGSGTTGGLSCSISAQANITCEAGVGGFHVIAHSGNSTVTIPTTPTAAVSLVNPRATNQCFIDPENFIAEGNEDPESSNACADTVPVVEPAAFPDLIIIKTNGLNGAHAVVSVPFNWILTFSNNGDAPADFTEGQRFLLDAMPFDALYGDANGQVTLSLGAGMTGTLTCGPQENLNRVISCFVGAGGFHIAAHSGSGTVTIPTTPTAAVPLVNPRGTNQCFVNPENHVVESDDSPTSNACTDTVTVDPAPATASISGKKFRDKNGNGTRETGEGGLAGWTINISGPVHVSMVTPANGNYSFTNLPAGTYTITETLQAGWTQTTTLTPTTITSGQAVINKDIGNFENGIIKGFKFEDLNMDGVRVAGEQKLSGWGIELHAANGSIEATTVTDAQGNYQFTDVGSGMHTLTEVQQSGWQQTSSPLPISLQSGQTSNINNFGNVKTTGDISGKIFKDKNANGTRETGEGGDAGWTVNLTGPVSSSTVSATNGNYSFLGLPQGTYTLTLVPQVGSVQTTSNPTRTIIVGSVFTNVDIGNFDLGTIKGFKFKDTNANGTREAGEQKLTGWTIVLHRPDSTTSTTVTDAAGNYQFTDVGPGTHTVTEVQQVGWTQSSANPAPITLLSGATSNNNNFGNHQ